MLNLFKLAPAALLLAAASMPVVAGQLDIQSVLAADASWNDTVLPGYMSGAPEMHVVKFKITPGTKTPVHLHPVNGAGYIISGELTLYSTNDPNGDFSDPNKIDKVVLKAGEAWAETVNTWHYGVNESDKDAEFVVMFAGEKGTPVTMSLGTYN